MTKRYAILQKKLEELKSELIKVLQLEAETPIHQLLSDGIHQRFVFLKNLLSAEIASHPSKPHHLDHIARRLGELDTAFREWDNYRSNVGNDFDANSNCSCTESCLNDDVDDGEGLPDLGSPVCDVPESFSEAVSEEKVDEEERVKVEEEIMEVKRSVRVWRHCGEVMGSGMILGIVFVSFVVASFSGCFHNFEYEGGLVPT